MILEFNKSANATPEQMVRSLMESVQRALDSISIPEETDTDAIIKQAKLAIYPVGSIYVSVDSTSPATLFGGTWARFGKGKTLVGLDESDTSFDVVEETGGEKTITLTVDEIPSHNHGQYADNASSSQYPMVSDAASGSSTYGGYWEYTGMTTSKWVRTSSEGGGDAHNNLQPYITVYMWKRTA